jgi:hypothetical protein
MIHLYAMLLIDAYAITICLMICMLITTNNPK